VGATRQVAAQSRVLLMRPQVTPQLTLRFPMLAVLTFRVPLSMSEPVSAALQPVITCYRRSCRLPLHGLVRTLTSYLGSDNSRFS